MEEQGHQVVVIAPLKSPLFLKARTHGLTTYPLSFKPLARLGEYGRIRQIFVTEKPFVVNSHGLEDAQLALKAARKTDVQCRIMSHHEGSPIKKFWGCKNLYKRYSHYVFTDCEATNRSLQQFFKLKNIRIFSIPCGIIEQNNLPRMEDARKELALRLGLPQDMHFIGINGWIPSDLNNDFILNVFNRIKNELPHHIVVALNASQPLSTEVKVSIEKKTQKRIHFINTTNDIWHLYRALDCGIIIPKKNKRQSAQGIPLSLLEAMYAECPVIAPGRPGITDIIEDQKNGLLYKDGDTSQLLEAITQTVYKTTKAQELSRTAQNHVTKHHTIAAMGRDILRIYRIHQVKLEKRLMA